MLLYVYNPIVIFAGLISAHCHNVARGHESNNEPTCVGGGHSAADRFRILLSPPPFERGPSVIRLVSS